MALRSAFIGLKELADDLLIDLSQKIIINYPGIVNSHRDMSKMYDALEVKAIIDIVDPLTVKCDIFEFINEKTNVFSSKGFEQLYNAVTSLNKRNKGFGLYTCPPYTFAVYKNEFGYILLDTHPVPAECLGTRQAQVIKSFDKSHCSLLDICCWILCRVALSMNNQAVCYHYLSLLD